MPQHTKTLLSADRWSPDGSAQRRDGQQDRWGHHKLCRSLPCRSFQTQLAVGLLPHGLKCRWTHCRSTSAYTPTQPPCHHECSCLHSSPANPAGFDQAQSWSARAFNLPLFWLENGASGEHALRTSLPQLQRCSIPCISAQRNKP